VWRSPQIGRSMGILQVPDPSIERFGGEFFRVEGGREQISCAESDGRTKDDGIHVRVNKSI
jgi:hypothetical protein